MAQHRTLAISTALALDNIGTGLYLPVAALFLIQERGFSIAHAGIVLGVGTAIGLAVPALAGVLVDRIGPRWVLTAGQLLQALSMAIYLLAPGWNGVLVASAVFAAGTQMFYGSLFSFLGGLPASGSTHDRVFALIDMTRAGAFGVGALIGAGVLAGLPGSMPVLLAGNLVLSVAGAAVILSVRVPAIRVTRDTVENQRASSVLRNRPFLGLVLLCFLISVVGDFFPIGFPVVAVEQLHAPTWLPSVCVALLTITSSTLTLAAVHLTQTRSRAFAVGLGVTILLAWILTMVAIHFLPASYVTAALIVATLIFAIGSLLIGTRLNAAANDAAPPSQRGKYLATFQYAFSIASLVAPLLLTAFAFATWLPWAILSLTLAIALVLLPLLRRTLPERVLGARPAERTEQPPPNAEDGTDRHDLADIARKESAE